MTFSLEGKTFVIMGVANKRSIAWELPVPYIKQVQS